MLTAVRSDIGRIREINQDYVFLSRSFENGLILAIVADGMGGHLAGEIASKMAVDTIYRELEHIMGESLSIDEYKEALAQAIYKANEEVYQESLRNEEYRGMGTTIVVAMVHPNWIILGHVGDSRAYLLDREKIEQLTRDHSLVSELLMNGQISEEEAISHPQKNILMRALGTEDTVKTDFQVREWGKGQTILLCTDGLTNQLSDKDIFEVVQDSSRSLPEIADHLLLLANQAGGDDNISVIIVQHE